MPKRLSLHFILVLLFILAIGFSNYLLLKNDNFITGVDVPNHLLFSIKFFDKAVDLFQNPNSSVFMKMVGIVKLLGQSLYGDIYWPNGLNSTAAMFYGLLGRSLLSVRLSLLPYVIILLLTTYSMGKLIYSSFVGLLAAFILFMNPLIFASSRQFQVDFPLTAMVAFSIYLLLRCNNFKDRKYSFFLGLSLGWAMLIKGQAIIFFIWPLLLVFYKIFKKPFREHFKNGQLLNIAIFVVIAGLIASIWWGQKIQATLMSLNEHIFSAQKSLESNFSWDKKYSFDAMFHNLGEMFNCSGPFLYLAFLIPFPFFLKHKSKYKEIILSWLVIPFLLFSLVFTVKYYRFLMPITPAVALISAWGLAQIRSKMIRLPILCIIVIYSIAQYCVLSYCPWHYRSISMGNLRIFGTLGPDTGYEAPPPNKEDFKIEKVVSIMRSYAPFSKPMKIGSISCGGRPTNLETIYFLKLQDRLLEAIDFTEMGSLFLENFKLLDFILFQLPSQSQLQWPGGRQFITLLKEKHRERIKQFEITSFKSEWELLLKTLEDAQSDFKLVGKVTKDDENVYLVYKRIIKKVH